MLNKCIPKDINYTPCQSQIDQLNNFNKLLTTSAKAEYQVGKDLSTETDKKGGGVIITCVEHALLCVESFYCLTDAECDDGNMCNGNESCVETRCLSAIDQSIETICGMEPHLMCVKGKGCVSDLVVTPTSGPVNDNDKAGIIVVIVVAVVLGLIFVMIIGFSVLRHYNKYYTKKENSKSKAKKGL
jgi:hypothetical protein